MQGKRRSGALLPIAVCALALVAGFFVNATPAAADEQSSSVGPAQGPVVAPPSSARAVATRTGTDVFISPPVVDSAGDDLRPTGYQVVACGPFALDSVQFNTAVGEGCESDPTRVSAEVPSPSRRVSLPCVPTEVTWCAVLVRARNGDQISEPTFAASGGVAPKPVVSLSARRTDAGVVLQWTAGADAQQMGSLPAFATGFEVRRNGRLLADFADGTTFIDARCALESSCAYSIRAVSAAGRSVPIVVVLKSGQDEASAVAAPAHRRLIARAEVAGASVTVSGAATPSASGAVLQLHGLDDDASHAGVTVPVNTAGGWTYTVSRSALGTHRLTVVETIPGRVDRSLDVDYSVKSVRISAAAKAPGAPLKVTAVATGTQVEIAWQTPANNGSPITKYIVTASTGGGTCTYTVPKSGSSANSCVIRGLVYGTAYTFSVKAYNAFGASPAATSASVTPAAAPAAPARPTAVYVSGGSATVTWTAPVSNGAAITSYKVTAAPGTATCTYTVPAKGASANTCTVPGLALGTSYTFTVTAKNSVGWSAASPASVALLARERPGAPTNVSGQFLDNSVRVAWTAPARNGGAAVTSYRASVVGDASKFCTYSVPNTGTPVNACTITGLVNGTSYTFIVIATNAVGDSAASAASAAVIPRAVPGVMAAPSVAYSVAGTQVRWTAPAANGSSITSYRVTASPGGTTCTYTVPTAGTPDYTCTIAGLSTGTAYTFTVAARNGVGWSSSESPASSAYTVPSLPGVPRNVVAQSMDASVSVSWDEPASTGWTAITSYKATLVTDATKTCTYVVPDSGTSANSCTIAGLTNGNSYQFTVTATNVVGESTASASTSSVVAGAPAAVTSVTATAENGRATITFANVATVPSGMNFQNYTVTVDGHPEIWGCTAYRSYSSYYPIAILAPTASCSISGLTNGVEYTFSVRANVIGPRWTPDQQASSPAARSNAVTSYAPPSAPQSVTVYSYNGGALLAWEAPSSNGGKPITAYRVTATPSSGDPLTYSYGAAARRVNVSGLENGVRYAMSVTAVTDQGTGTAVASSAALFTAKTSAPTGVEAVGGDRSAVVSWTEPSSVPFPILEYTITATDYYGTSEPITVTADASGVTVDGLLNGHTYTFTVTATNGAGESPRSTASAMTLVATLPQSVSAASVESGNRYVTVTWTPVGYEQSGGAPVTDYVITATPVSGDVITKTVQGAYTWDWSSLTTAISASDGLIDGVDYAFTVAATNSKGVSPATSAGTTHSIGAPSASVITSTVSANGRVTVTWNAPASDGGSAITRYNVSASWSTCVVFPSGPGPYSCTVYGLSNGYSYPFVVEAQNAAGSSYSNSWWASPRTSAPDVPNSASAIASAVTQGAATVSWEPPGDNGGSTITSFTATSNPGGRTCSAYSSTATSCTVYGLTPGISYTFSVTATSVLGTSAASEPSNSVLATGRPGQPNAPVVTGGPTTATVSFTPPSSNGLAITEYEVSIIEMDPLLPNPPAVTGTQSPITVTGLVLGHTYRFAVTARNAMGTGWMSPTTSDWISANKPSAPSITAVTPGTDSVYVAFTTPANGGAPITSYELVAIDDSEAMADTIVRAASSPAEIPGLVTGHSYRVTVRATNVAGDSGSSIVSASVMPQAVPGAPSGVVPTSVDGGLSVTFEAPTVTGGSAVTGYRVRAHDSVTGADTYATGSSSPISIGGLVNGRSYVVSVQATKSAYIAGPYADGAVAGVPAGVPGAPTDVIAANSQDARSSVSFTAPSSNGAAITSYTVTAVDQAAPFTVITATGPTSPVVITGLTNLHDYRISVAATNRMGTGEATPNVGYTRPVAPPGVPTNVAASVTSATSVSVAFTAPADNGGSPVLSYTVTATDLDDAAGSRTVVGYGSPIAVSGLVAGDTYSFAVSATNTSATGAASNAVPVVPQGVSGVSTTAGHSQVEVEWVTPSPAFGESATYTAATNTGELCTSSGSSCVIVGLTDYTTYSITVSAANASGTSASTSPINATPIPVSVATSVPSPPRNVAAAPQINGFGDGAATVTWDPPADSGGGAITGYVVTTSPADGSCVTQFSRTCVLTGLDPYALYTVRVVATNSIGSSGAGSSAEVSACGFDTRLARCKWKVAGQEVRAEQVDGGVRVSWRYGSASTATAMPSGRTCTSLTFDPITLRSAPLDSQNRQYCVISGSFDAAATFRVNSSEFDSSSAVHATWISATAPAYTRAATPHVTGTLTDGTAVTIVASPVSCNDPLTCDEAVTFTGSVASGTFDVPLTDIAEGSYRVFVANPLLERVLARTTPTTMVVDRTNPTPLTVPVGPSASNLGVDFEKTATVFGLAECDSVNEFTVDWYAGSSASGAVLRSTSPERTALGSVCWYSDTLPGAADGTYTVVVRLADPSGNFSSVSENVVVDSVAPDLSVLVPLAGETVPSGIVSLSGTSNSASADASDVTVSAVRGTTVLSRSVAVAANGSWGTELPLDSGSWTLTFMRTDRAGNVTTATRAITVVDSPTTVSIIQPMAGDVVASVATVRGWAIPGSQVAVESADSLLATATAAADGSWSASVSLASSATSLSASVGSVRVDVSISVGTASTAVSIATPGVGGRTNGRPLTGSGPIGATVTVTVDSTPTDVVVGADGQWSLPLVGFAVGSHAVAATDGATSATATVVIDRTAPIVSILSPAAGSTKSSSVAVTAPSVVSDASSVQMSYFLGTDTSVDAEFVADAEVSGGAVISAFPSALADGQWTLVVTRSDAAGNVGTAQTTFTYDRQAPAITSNVASRMPGPLTISGVAGTAAGDGSLTVSIDGADWTAPAAGAFSHSPSSAITTGVHSVVLRQVDEAGNETIRSTSVTVDSVPPSLTMSLDGTGAQFAGLVVTGSASGDDGRVDITATECTPDTSPCDVDPTTRTATADPVDGSYSQSLALTGGYWFVTAHQVDAAGNSTARSGLVLVDIEAPELTMATPLATVASGSLTVSGSTASDYWRDPQVHVSVTRVGASVASYATDVTVVDGAYSVTTPVIADGAYDVVVTRADPVHAAEVDRRVVVDTSGPELTVDAVPEHAVQTFCVSAGTAASDIATVSFLLSLPSAAFSYAQVVSVSAGRACVAPSSEGVWDISATQVDSLGNDTVTDPVSVPFDFTAPDVFVNNPAPAVWNTARWASTLTGTAGVASQDTSLVRVTIEQQNCARDCTRELTAEVGSDGTWTADLSGVAEGSWRVLGATQRDAAGNVGSFSSSSYYSLTYLFRVDHTLPSAPTLSGSSATGRVRMQACAGSAAVPFTLTVKLYRSGGAEPVNSSSFEANDNYWCTDAREVVFRNLLIGASRFPNGNYSVVAEMSDPLGHVSRSSSIPYVSNWVTPVVAIGQIAAGDDPSSVSSSTFGQPLTVSGSGTYNDFDPRTVTVTFDQLSGDQSYRDSLSSSAYIAVLPIAADGTWSTVVPANLPVGSYRVTAVQGAGNATKSFAVTLPAPVVESATVTGERAPGSIDPASTQTITVSGSMPLATTTPSNVLGTEVTMTDFPRQLPAAAVKTCTPVVTGDRWTCTLVGEYPNGSYTFTATTRVSAAYTRCTALSEAGVCTTQSGSGVQRITGSRTVTLNGEVPYPSLRFDMEPVGGWDTYGSNNLYLKGTASNRAGDLMGLTIKIYRRSDLTHWPLIVETPYATYSTTASAFDGWWSKEIYVGEGRWVVQVSQSNEGGLVGYSWPREFTVDTSAPVISISSPTSGQVIPAAGITGTITGGYGIKAGSADTSNLSYAQDGSVTYYQGWAGTAGAQGGFQWISTNVSRTWALRNNTGFSSSVSLAPGKWTAVVAATDENGRRATRSIEFEVNPSVLPATPIITARLDGVTPITSGQAVSTSVGSHVVVVRVAEKYGNGLSRAPSGWATLRYGEDTILREPLINREARFTVPFIRGSVPMQAGFEGSADNRSVNVMSNFLGTVNVAAATAHDFVATFDYPGGAAAPGVAKVSALYDAVTPFGTTVTLPCSASTATVTDSAGKVLGSGSLTNGGKFPLAATASGTQTFVVDVAEGRECGAMSGTFSVTLAQTATPSVIASVASTPVPYVGGDAVVNASLPVSSLMPLAVGVPVHVENSLGETVSRATVLSGADGSAVLHVTPSVAGNVTLTVVAGGDRSGFQRTTASVTVPVEPSAVTMALSVDSAGTHAGDSAEATLVVGGPGSSGTVSLASGQVAGVDAETLAPTLVCAADCRVTSRFPVDVRDAGVGGRLLASYTSATTGRVFTRTVATGQTAWPTTVSDVLVGAGPPLSLTAVSGGSGTVNLAWVAPRTVGSSTITGYRVDATIGGLSVGQCSTSATSCTISGLPNDTAIRFAAVTRTSAGDSGVVTTSAAASAQVTQTPVPVEPTQSLANTVLRDHLAPVTTTVVFPVGMAAKFRTGTVTFHSVETVFCGNSGPANSRVPTYCTPTHHDVTVDLTTGATTDTLVVSDVSRSSISAESLAAAGITLDMLTPRSSMSSTTTARGVEVTVTSQVFVGAYSMGVTAEYSPANAAAVAASSAARASEVTGAGAPVIRVAIGSATITGGKYAPTNLATRREGAERVLSWTNWGVRNPRVGETAFIRATIDPVFGVDDDAYAPLALAVSQPGVQPLFASPDSFLPNDRLYSSSETYGTERVTIDAASTSNGGQPQWRKTVAGTGLTCPTRCVVWALRNADSADPVDAGGLSIGSNDIGVMSYATSGRGIVSTTLNVDQWATTQSTQAALTSETAGQKIRILTAARWIGMAPEVQTSMANVMLSVQLTHAGVSQVIAICFYSGVCLSNDGNGTSFLKPEITPIGGRMALEIDPVSLGYTLTRADTIVVTTTTPWGVPAVSSSLALNPTAVAVSTSGVAQISTSGQWLGGVLQEPATHSEWWWAANTAMDWFRSAQHSLWMSIFRSEAVASFLMTVTNVGLSMIPVWNIFTAMTCATWSCAAFAMASVVAGPVFSGLKSGFAAFKALRAASAAARPASAAATAPGRVARFLTSVKSRATATATRVTTSVPGQLARQMAWAAQFRISQLNQAWLFFGKLSVQTAQAEIIKTIIPGRESLDEIVADYVGAGQTEFATSLPANDPAFREIPDFTVLAGDRMVAVDESTQGRQVAAWDQAVADAYAAVAASNPVQPIDVGYGPGVAMQFAQQFSSQISIALPNLDGINLNASKVQAFVMDSAYDASLDDWNHARYPSLGEGTGLAGLGSCTFVGTCATIDGITATVFRGSVEFAGMFPQSVSWFPRGAWIKYLVTVVSNTGRTTIYRAASNISFPGRVATDIEAGSDGAVTMAYVRPYGTDPVGPYVPWPTGTFDPKSQYSPDTAILTGGL